PAPAIAAIGAAEFDEFLAPERHAARTAAARADVDFCKVKKLHSGVLSAMDEFLRYRKAARGSSAGEDLETGFAPWRGKKPPAPRPPSPRERIFWGIWARIQRQIHQPQIKPAA